jgi:AbrB family looped-hinge helix DNA binding protein
VEIVSEIDTKGRVTIPKEIRDKYGLRPRDRVKLRVVEPMPRRSFIKECKGILEGEGDAVELMHKKSPFRF